MELKTGRRSEDKNMPFDITNISENALIFGGLSLVSLSLVWVLYRIVTNHGHDWEKAINRNSDAFLENAKSNVVLVETLKSVAKKAIKKK